MAKGCFFDMLEHLATLVFQMALHYGNFWSHGYTFLSEDV